MTEPTSVTVPAFAADTLGETLTVRVPAAWADRVRALGPFCSYGPRFTRGVVEALQDADRCVRNGYSAIAYDHLLAAERRAGIDAESTARDAR
jgi:hypothetical protein